jgi:hypothetical protein
MRRPRLLLAPFVVASGLLAAACGSSNATSATTAAPSNGVASKSPTQIAAATEAAVGSARSVHIAGTISATGTLDYSAFSNGDVDASLTIKGSPVQLRTVSKTTYTKAPAAFYVAFGVGASSASKLADRWVIVQASVANGLPTLKSLATSLSQHTGPLSAAGTSTISGQPVVGVKSSNGGTLWVATTGTPFPVRLSAPSGKSGELTFSEWNTATPPTAPAGAKSIASLLG